MVVGQLSASDPAAEKKAFEGESSAQMRLPGRTFSFDVLTDRKEEKEQRRTPNKKPNEKLLI